MIKKVPTLKNFPLFCTGCNNKQHSGFCFNKCTCGKCKEYITVGLLKELKYIEGFINNHFTLFSKILTRLTDQRMEPLYTQITNMLIQANAAQAVVKKTSQALFAQMTTALNKGYPECKNKPHLIGLHKYLELLIKKDYINLNEENSNN